MASIPTQIQTDSTIKEHANNVLPELPNYNQIGISGNYQKWFIEFVENMSNIS